MKLLSAFATVVAATVLTVAVSATSGDTSALGKQHAVADPPNSTKIITNPGASRSLGKDGTLYIYGSYLRNLTDKHELFVEAVNTTTQHRLWTAFPDQLDSETHFFYGPQRLVAETAHFTLHAGPTLQGVDRYWIFSKNSTKVGSSYIFGDNPDSCVTTNVTNEFVQVAVDEARDVFYMSNGLNCITRTKVQVTPYGATFTSFLDYDVTGATRGSPPTQLLRGGTFQLLGGRLFFQTADSLLVSAPGSDDGAENQFDDRKDSVVVPRLSLMPQSASGISSSNHSGSALTAAYGNLYFTTRNALYCLDATSFHILWYHPVNFYDIYFHKFTGNTATTTPTIQYWTDVAPVAANNQIYTFRQMWDVNGNFSFGYSSHNALCLPADGSTPSPDETLIAYGGDTSGWENWAGIEPSQIPIPYVFDFGNVFFPYAGPYFTNTTMLPQMYQFGTGDDQVQLDTSADRCSSTVAAVTPGTLWLVCSRNATHGGGEVIEAIQVDYKANVRNSPVELGGALAVGSGKKAVQEELASYLINPGTAIIHSPEADDHRVTEFFDCPASTVPASSVPKVDYSHPKSGIAYGVYGGDTHPSKKAGGFPYWSLGVVFGIIAVVGIVVAAIIVKKKKAAQGAAQSLQGSLLVEKGQNATGYEAVNIASSV